MKHAVRGLLAEVFPGMESALDLRKQGPLLATTKVACGQGEGVGVYDPLQLCEARPEILPDCWQHDGGHLDREDHQHRRQRNDRQHPPPPGVYSSGSFHAGLLSPATQASIARTGLAKNSATHRRSQGWLQPCFADIVSRSRALLATYQDVRDEYGSSQRYANACVGEWIAST